MSITNDNTEEVFIGTGATTEFATEIVAFFEDQVEVYLREDDVDTLQTLTTHYTVTGLKEVGSLAADDEGITITFVTAPTIDQEVVVVRATDRTQDVALTSTRAYNPEVLMQQLDLIVMMMQELATQTERAFKVLPGLGSPTEVTDTDALAELVTYAAAAAASAAAAAASAAAAAAAENTLITPRSAWLTATAYAPSDIVRQGTAQYICLIAHTSGVFATDLAALRWEVWLQDGAAGAGTGDMLSTNNLSEIPDDSTALVNLGFSPLGLAFREAGATSTHAAGTDAQGQGLIAANVSFVYVTAIGSVSAVTLPNCVTDQTGRTVVIINPDGSTANLKIYPGVGDNFQGYATNTAITVQPGWQVAVWQRTIDEWAFTLIPRDLDAYIAPKVWDVLSDQTVTGASVAQLDFTQFVNATYEEYEFELILVTPVTDGSILCLRTSTDGATYDSGASDYTHIGMAIAAGSGLINDGVTASALRVTAVTYPVGNATGEGVTGEIALRLAGNGSASTAIHSQVQHKNTAGTLIKNDLNGQRNTAQDTVAVRFLFSAGNIAVGSRIVMRGRR